MAERTNKTDIHGEGNAHELIACWRTGNYKMRAVLIYVFFAYWLGIAQDFYYGIVYLSRLVSLQEARGSFPFMFGWTSVMIWGVMKPVERRIALFLTGLLVVFMLVENLILLACLKYVSNPLMPIAGAFLWFSSYWIAGRICRESGTVRGKPNNRCV
jgi:hypothetical protein